MELHVKTIEPGLCDDIALMSSCYTHMQTKTRQLNQFAARTGLRINKKKTQILRINSKCENIILIDDQELKEVDKYNYLGANVSKQGGGGDDNVKRIHKARVSFRKLKQIWSSNIYTLRSKLRLFNTLVKPVLLYENETWKINEGDNRKLDKKKCQVLEMNPTNSMAIHCIKSRYSRKNKIEDNQHRGQVKKMEMGRTYPTNGQEQQM